MSYNDQAYDDRRPPIWDMPPPPPPPGFPSMAAEPPPPPPPYRFGADSYRRPEQHSRLRDTFSYRNSDVAPDWDRAADTYRPLPHNGNRRGDTRPRQENRAQARRERFHDRQVRRGHPNGNNQGRPFRPFRQKILPADRALLKHTDNTGPEVILGHARDEGRAKRFMAADDISDSEEENMAESDLEGSPYEPPDITDITSESPMPEVYDVAADVHPSSEPPAKRRAVEKRADSDAVPTSVVPKWSNPDPYTVLPPVDEEQRKRRDVVKMIRKARISAADEARAKNEVTANDDFISFGGGEGAEESDSGSSVSASVKWDPDKNFLQQADLDILQPQDSDLALGNRKRTLDDRVKGYQPRYIRKKPIGNKPTGALLDEWIPSRGVNPTPWVIGGEHSATTAFRLHKEICDYYEYVRPTGYERIVRQDLLDRLQALVRQYDRRWTMYCFGSFAAGLYLPNADMDVVVMSDQYRSYDRPSIAQNYHKLQKLADYFSRNMAIADSVEVIASAKVPLIKFEDKQTGINVDISFENNTGLMALQTFERWRTQYPAMPVLVVLIKQFLKMRGMSEVVSGGLGGFSVTCMVTSLLQNLPRVQSGEICPEDNLGEMLIEFLDFYGNRMDLARTGLNMDPPGYFSKDTYFDQRSMYIRGLKADQARNKLTIIDPNVPSNDISGGSKHSDYIMEKFSEAHKVLMGFLRDAGSRSSLLCWMLGGDYKIFHNHRKHLHQVYEQHWGQSGGRLALPEGGVTSRPFSKLENAGTEKLCDNERSSSASDIWEQSMLDAAPRTSDEEQLLGEFTDAVNSELKKIALAPAHSTVTSNSHQVAYQSTSSEGVHAVGKRALRSSLTHARTTAVTYAEMVRGSIDTDSQLLGDARQLLRDQKSKRRKATRRGRGNLGRFRVRAKAVNTDPSKDIATKEADRSRPRNMSASTTSQQNNLHLWEQLPPGISVLTTNPCSDASKIEHYRNEAFAERIRQFKNDNPNMPSNPRYLTKHYGLGSAKRNESRR